MTLELNAVSYLERPVTSLSINPDTAILKEGNEDSIKLREKAINRATVTIDGEKYKTSRRFWKTINNQFKIHPKIYNLFSPEEVINRIARNVGGETEYRFAVQDGTLMGMSHLEKHYLPYQDALEFLYENGFEDIRLGQGFLEGHLTDNKKFLIGPDEFKARRVLRLPVDGLSSATFYASMLRLICTNGITGFSRALSSPINVSHKSAFESLKKAVDNSRGAGESHEMIASKVELMQTSALSMAEARMLSKGFKSSGYEKEGGAFDKVSNIYRYGIETISQSKDVLKNLPCVGEDNKILSTYDALNYITQITSRPEEHVSTHSNGADRLRAFVTELIVKDLDLPDMIKDGRDFEGVFDMKMEEFQKE